MWVLLVRLVQLDRQVQQVKLEQQVLLDLLAQRVKQVRKAFKV
jgi:hypothetical protein